MKIDELLILPEGKTLEFKRDLSSPKPVLRTLVAFAKCFETLVCWSGSYAKHISA